MNKKYTVRLTEEERQMLLDLVAKGNAAAYKIKHANILGKVDADGAQWTDEITADAFSCHANTVRNVRQRFVEQGIEAALNRKKLPPRQSKVDGRAEACVIALRCGDAPEGSARWTLRLLADKLVELEMVEEISHETVRTVLKKTS